MKNPATSPNILLGSRPHGLPAAGTPSLPVGGGVGAAPALPDTSNCVPNDSALGPYISLNLLSIFCVTDSGLSVVRFSASRLVDGFPGNCGVVT